MGAKTSKEREQISSRRNVDVRGVSKMDSLLAKVESKQSIFEVRFDGRGGGTMLGIKEKAGDGEHFGWS